MGTFIKTILIVAVVAAITAYIGLVVMSGVASSHGVKHVAVPAGCYAASVAGKADYSDAYRKPMEYVAFRSIDEVAANAFAPGKEVQRSDTEVAYSGYRGGVRYDVSFLLDRSATPPTITVATAIRLPDQKARVSWFFGRRIHRFLYPYLLDRMAQLARDD